MLCFDAAKGNVLWSKNLKLEYEIKVPIWGIAAALLWARGDEAIVVGMIAFTAAGAPFMLDALRRQLHTLLMLIRIEDRLGPGPVVPDGKKS